MPETDKNAIASNFSAAAQTYSEYAQVQQATAVHLAKLISKYISENCTTIADLGCGTGFLTRQLIDNFPQAQLYCIDIASKMLQECKQILAPLNRLNDQYINADIQSLTLPQPVSLAASNYALQWTDRDEALKNIFRNLCEKGFCALAVPVCGSFAELHSAYKTATGNELKAYPSINDYCSSFAALGMKIIYKEEHAQVCRFDTALLALKSLKKIGANFARHSGYKQLNPGKTIKLINEYDKLQPTGATLSYHTLYIIAQKN